MVIILLYHADLLKNIYKHFNKYINNPVTLNTSFFHIVIIQRVGFIFLKYTALTEQM